MTRYRRLILIITWLVMAALLLPGCGPAAQTAVSGTPAASVPAVTAAPDTLPPSSSPETARPTASAVPAEASPKYVFLFIGDGMSSSQVEAAGLVTESPLAFTGFPVQGSAATGNAAGSVTDSAAAGTAIACGQKTRNGIIGYAADGKTGLTSIASLFRKAGRKVGIVTSVTLNHATPAAFYARSAGRDQYYAIALQMADSGFDYFGGGGLLEPNGKKGKERSIYEILAGAGYQVARTKDEIQALGAPVGKVYAQSPVLQDSGSLPYEMDASDKSLRLADFVEKGISVLDGENGFFLMCESGKIDWACHANDAAAAAGEVLALDRAVRTALGFAAGHPGEVLILVTADHETGGMALNGTDGRALLRQKLSRVAFFERFMRLKSDHPRLTLAETLPLIREAFGLAAPGEGSGDAGITVMSGEEYARVKAAFAETMKPAGKRKDTAETKRLYGGYDPLSVTLTRIVGEHAGIRWKGFSHTGVPVPVYAWGAGAEAFAGSYDNTDIFRKLKELCLQ